MSMPDIASLVLILVSVSTLVNCKKVEQPLRVLHLFIYLIRSASKVSAGFTNDS